MALYHSRGRISEMSEVKSGTTQSGYEWQRMTLTIEVPGFQGSVYKQVFSVSGDHVKEVSLHNIGDRVDITWSMYAREFNGRLYNNVDLVKIETPDYTKQDAPTEEAPVNPHLQELTGEGVANSDTPDNDLPW